MNRAGAIEVLMPALQPTEIWEQAVARRPPRMCCSRSRTAPNRQWFLSPTAEEVITTMAASEINSYRQLPKNFYQVSSEVPR
jgi:prolyl-tRNA synthetase